MNEGRSPVVARVKLTLCAEERFFGPGVCELMERINETGSIQAAAARMEMSYTKAWRILKQAEAGMGVQLIARVTGGRNGGSSTLTEAGRRAVEAFREMEAVLTRIGNELYMEHMDAFRPADGEDCNDLSG